MRLLKYFHTTVAKSLVFLTLGALIWAPFYANAQLKTEEIKGTLNIQNLDPFNLKSTKTTSLIEDLNWIDGHLLTYNHLLSPSNHIKTIVFNVQIPPTSGLSTHLLIGKFSALIFALTQSSQTIN